MNKQIQNIAIFFSLAFGLSFLANQMPELKYGNLNVKLILCGFGPLVSGLLCYQLLKTQNVIEISLLGTRPVLSVALYVISLGTFCLTQSENELLPVLSYYFGHTVYCFGEQFGWRHYLQNETNYMNEWIQSFLIGFLWFCWHFSFVDNLPAQMLGREDMSLLIFSPIMIVLLSLLSYLFGMMVKRTQSLLFPVTAHLLFKTGSITLLVTATVICVMLILWNKKPSIEIDENV